jgi:MFS family permease
VTTAGVPDADALPAPPATWWTARVGGFPRSFWFLWTGTIVNRAGSFVVPFLALYLTGDRDVSVAQAGVVLSLLGLGSAIGQTVGGVLADRVGRRRTMVLGTRVLSRAGESVLWGGAFGLSVLAAIGLMLVSRAADRRAVAVAVAA